MKNILVVGEHSYIGTSFAEYMAKGFPDYTVECISSRDDKWKGLSFSKYDVVLDVAGIAHIKATCDMESLFYAVNRDLAIELCKKARDDKVKQFIYLSSMNVYGDTTDKITSLEQENPRNFYGMSKYQADLAIQKMNSDAFTVASIRPPVVYGNGCKGNFALLEKASKYIPIFLNFDNKKSVIFIDNLCEFIRIIIDTNERGIFHPQNSHYTSTKEIIKTFREIAGKRTLFLGGFNWLINILSRINHTVFKVFADDYYDCEFSTYSNIRYTEVSFIESIQKMVDGAQ